MDYGGRAIVRRAMECPGRNIEFILSRLNQRVGPPAKDAVPGDETVRL
jgi:hypothetical protein